MKRLLIGAAVLALCVLGGVLVFRHFVTDHVLDGDGMENPDWVDSTENIEMLDGDHTYVANNVLLEVIAGTWESGDDRFLLEIRDDCGVRLFMDGEAVLDEQIQFTYLQPGYVFSTDFDLDSGELRREQTFVGRVTAFYHEAGSGSGSIFMKVAYEDDSSEMIELKKIGE